MRYDLDLVKQLCAELGLPTLPRPDDVVGIQLEPGLVLLVANAEDDQDCLIGLEGSEWHFHDNFIASDRHGNCIELDYLQLVSGIAEGAILVCELWSEGSPSDRWLVHRDYVDEFRHLQTGDEVRIRPAVRSTAGSE